MYKVKTSALRSTANVAQFSKLVSKTASAMSAPTQLYMNHTANGIYVAGNQKRWVSFNSMEKAMGQYAADTYIESMNLNSKSVVSKPYAWMYLSFCGAVVSFCLKFFDTHSCVDAGHPFGHHGRRR